MAIKYSSGTKSRLIVTLVVFAMLVASPTTGSTALGFISLDCGSPEGTNYTDETTRINYISDSIFIQSGTIETILPSYQTKSIQQQFSSVRAFPEGTRNCYTLTPAQGKFKQYLIRASFFYGNYDSKDQLPSFDLHLGVNYWGPVTLVDARTPINVEIIYIPQTDYIDVCLVKTGSTTPFISSLELRLLNNTNIMYTSQHGSLHLFYRLYFNYGTTRSIRYDDDSYDRIWQPFSPLPNTTTLSTESTISQNLFQLPSAVMQSACTPLNSSMPIQFYWNARNTSEQYYIYMHFAELAPLQANQHRQFSIYLNNEIFYENVVPRYLAARTIFSTSPQANNSRYRLTLKRTLNSTLPPIINAIEIYTVKEFLMKETYEKDVSAMWRIKSLYKITRNWQGDPCAPQDFVWDGLICSYDGFPSPRITSLNLSKSQLNGVIPPSISNLTTLEHLDLSNNNLTGKVPDFLGLLTSLKTINLKGNHFTGPIPSQLLERSKNGLSLSMDDMDTNTKTRNLVPVVASVAAALFVICAAALITLCMIKRRRQQGGKQDNESNKNKGTLMTKNQQFTYSEVLGITNNFQKVIGKGGFGTVYHGYVGDTQVAVKMLSSSSTQGYKEFQAEASILTSVRHKNLSILVGYCNEGTNIGIIYEYMSNGNLYQHLLDKNIHVLSWEERLQIATDAACGLEYLHHGCKPPIVHRDVKTSNILLNEKLQAKLTDFGLSRAFPVEGDSCVSTVVAGTPGYLDPEYHTSGRLNEKSDVYGFGIVLLEIITGCPAIAKTQDRTHITQWVTTAIRNGDVSNIVDPRLKGDFDINSAWKAVELAMACASRVSSKRPTMNEVVLELKQCLTKEMVLQQNDDIWYTESTNSTGMIV